MATYKVRATAEVCRLRPNESGEHRRAGLVFNRLWKKVSTEKLAGAALVTAEQLEQLRTDPHLVIKESEPAAASPDLLLKAGLRAASSAAVADEKRRRQRKSDVAGTG